MDDIENILRSTGLSCEDLLNKLLRYNQNKNNVGPENSNGEGNAPKLENESEIELNSLNNANINHKNNGKVQVNDLNKIAGTVLSTENLNSGLHAKRIEGFSKNKVCSRRKNKKQFQRLRSPCQYLKTKIIKKYKERLRFPKKALKFHKCIQSDSDNISESEVELNEVVAAGDGTVRNEIMQQLELLRKRKSTDFVDSYKPSPIIMLPKKKMCYEEKNNIKNNRQSLLISSKENDVSDTASVIINDFPEKFTNYNIIDEIDLISDEEDSKDSLSNPTLDANSKLKDLLLNNDGNLKIIDIKYGSEALLLEKTLQENSNCIIDETDDEVIKPSKTNDITKIKGWKHKKFLVPKVLKEAEQTKSIPLSLEDSQPCCSYSVPVEKVVDTDKVNATENMEEPKQNAFASMNLEGFLEYADLDISYNIPKLNSEDTLSNKKHTLFEEPVKTHVVVKEEKIRNQVKKPRTVAEIRKIECSEKQRKNNEKVSKFNNIERNDFIYFNGKKIRVYASTLCNKRLYIGKYGRVRKKEYSFVPLKRNKNCINHIKPSLLNALKSKELNQKVLFSPGPLSKKQNLQISQQNNMRTVIKKLPKVYLEVKPEFRKSINPDIESYVVYNDFGISEDRLEFALSALKMKDENENSYFRFPVAYHHKQEDFILYEQLLFKVPPSKLVEPENDIADIVDNVLKKILDYCEVKEIEDSIVKEEKLFDDSSTEIKDPEILKEINKKMKKRTKTSLELKRLNVKVIEVDVEENNKPCTEKFCTLGCVCSSINNSRNVNDHCGNQECMFECKCNFQNSKYVDSKLVLPEGADLLSIGTVNRLQQHAKKDLAKVEKEFTQTVIKANNQTIIVSGNHERQKRISKTPKKLQDFIELSFKNEDELLIPDKYRKEIEFKPCYVSLPKMDLSYITPFCLIHKLYNCRCLKKDYTAQEQVQVLREPAINNTKLEEASTRKLSFKSIKSRIPRKSDVMLHNETKLPTENVSVNRNKRKQTFQDIRNEEDVLEKEPALQRRKKKPKLLIKSNISPADLQVKQSSLFSYLENKKDCAQIIPSKSLETQFLRVLNKNSVAKSKFRLLPWNTLYDKFSSDEIFVWYYASNDSNISKVLVTDIKKKPKSSCFNIKLLKEDTPVSSIDIIKWLLSGKVPSDKNADDILTIFMSTTITSPKCWEICGVLEKNLINVNNNAMAFRPSSYTTKPNENDKPENKCKIYEGLFFSKTLENESNSSEKIVLNVSLPDKPGPVKWRMLYMNSNFSVLSLNQSKARIKYSDLFTMVKNANKIKRTLVLVGEPNDREYVNGTFGIYAVPECEDKVFVGPYELNEEHNFETLRFANRILVNTDMFHKLQGTTNEKTSIWMYVKAAAPSRSLLRNNAYSLQLQNLDKITKPLNVTEEDFEIIIEPTAQNQSLPNPNDNATNFNEYAAHNKKVKYIVTNIPKFGYIEARTFTHKRVIDICWPETEGAKKFSLESEGLAWLIKDLSRYLVPVPFFFKLQLKMLDTKPDMDKLQLSWIQGCPIVGEFGFIQDLYSATTEALVNLGINKMQTGEILKARLVKILLSRCYDICKEFLPPKQLSSIDNIGDFIKIIIEEIHNLNYQCLSYTKEKEVMRKKQRALEECKIGLKKQVETKRQLEKLRMQARESTSKTKFPVGRQETLKTRDADILLFDALEKRRRKTYLDQLKNNEELVVEEVTPYKSSTKAVKKRKSCSSKLSPIITTIVNKKDDVICIDSDDDDNPPNIIPNKTSLLKPISNPNTSNSLKFQNQNISNNNVMKLERRTESPKTNNIHNKKNKLESSQMSTSQNHPYLKVKNFATMDSNKIYREVPLRVSETPITAQVLLQQKTISHLTNPKLEALANAIRKQLPEGKHIEYKLMNNCVFLLQKNQNQKVENIYQLGVLKKDSPVTKIVKIDNTSSITVPISKSPVSTETKKNIYVYKSGEDKPKVCTAEKIINGQLMRLQLFPKKKN